MWIIIDLGLFRRLVFSCDRQTVINIELHE